jgi:hypothetical protein
MIEDFTKNRADGWSEYAKVPLPTLQDYQAFTERR